MTSDLIVAESIGVGGSRFAGDTQYWQEARPGEGGRVVVVRRTPDGTTHDCNQAPFSARTRVHEYGGAAWLVHENVVYFSNFADQQVYVQPAGDAPRQLTHSPHLRFANGIVDAPRSRIIYVIEDHTDTAQEARNMLGAVDIKTGDVSILTSGHDFYSSPVISQDGSRLAWMTWDHPAMPWDSSQIWLASLDGNGLHGQPICVAGGPGESVQQPRFAPNGDLFYISDRSGWWNIYRQGERGSICPRDAEFGSPHWAFGLCSYVFRSANEILCVYGENNQSVLASLNVATGTARTLATPFTDIGGIDVHGHACTFVGASPTQFPCIVNLDIASGHYDIIKKSCSVELDKGYYSIPTAIDFVTAGDDTAHAFYYPPTNKDFEAPNGELPPLIVEVHGGPTAATRSALSLGSQFWTSRGFSLLDVNYRGSTGYGRAYREKLKGAWGIVDVEDTVHGARHLVDQGLADPARLAIHGGSAGGYTTLAALTMTSAFKAGASFYGVADLGALARDTHKFESRYLDGIVGRYPEDIEIYKARSPLEHVDGLNCPVIFFQGLEDKIVPPNQAEAMVEALRKKRLPVAYVPFEGEQHGFRMAKNIKRRLDLELFFYAKIFGFVPSDPIEPIEIENL